MSFRSLSLAAFSFLQRYRDHSSLVMKYTLLLLTLILTTSQANFNATFRNNLLINPDTNQPFTGNLDVINNDWGKGAVEFNKDYVDGVLHGEEKSYYQSGKLRSVGSFKRGILDGIVTGTMKTVLFK